VVEDGEGYRAYAQINIFPYRGIDVSMRYKPTRDKGSGRQVSEALPTEIDVIIKNLKIALDGAKRYEKDSRQPKSPEDGYLI
jgi:hypothetical protein